MFPIPPIPGFAGLEVLVPKGGTFFPGNTRVLLNYKLWLLFGYFGLCVSRCQQARRGISILAGVSDLDQQEEEGVLSKQWAGKNLCGP